MNTENTARNKSRYIIGIDLGTTNCALSYVDSLEKTPRPKVFHIPQWESEDSFSAAETLPSFYYLPPKSDWKKGQFNPAWSPSSSEPMASTGAPDGGGGEHNPQDYVVGRLAQSQASITPGRVVHSAKSWLCHGGVNREERILPWHSDEIVGRARRSPVEVSAAYLSHLKDAWNQDMASIKADYRLERQDVTITVPASFDEVAQRLTLEAARQAGFDLNLVRLLEEPQAAFYHWLAGHEAGQTDGQSVLHTVLPRLKDTPQSVLIVDVGGGTTDFSLFQVDSSTDSEDRPAIRRLSVSNHLLLGGDNIDLAIAYELERRMTGGGKKLSSRSWAELVSESRKLKERCLAAPVAPSEGGGDQELFVSVAGEGSSLFGSTQTASIRQSEITELICAGFLPPCSADDRPRRAQTGLKEYGLPYAQDSAITRHLAGFLSGGEVDAVLFTGGTLKPAFIQGRLSEAISEWQKGRPPVVLENTEMDLAVSMGAAYYGRTLREPKRRITGGYARSLYVEVARSDKKDPTAKHALVCIIPHGLELGQTVELSNLNLKALTGQPVRFQLYSSPRRPQDEVGDVINLKGDVFHPLPPVYTKLDLSADNKGSQPGKIDVVLEASIKETGLLELYCVRKGDESQRWQLNFNIRALTREETSEEPDGSQGGLELSGAAIPKDRIRAGRERIEAYFGKKKHQTAHLGNPKYLARELEEIFGAPRDTWDTPFLRSLWPVLKSGLTRRGRSIGHETSWLYMAGYCLRPGYGFELDEWRVGELWRVFEMGMSFPKERQVEEQWWIMWRRVAGGLEKDQQEALFDKVFPAVRKGETPSAEVYMLIGSLERVDVDKKIRLGNQLVQQLAHGQKQYLDQKIWALARIASRVPLYAGPETVIRPKFVEEWAKQLNHLDCRNKTYQKLNLFYSQAARMVGDREFDLSDDMRRSMLKRMESCHASQELILPVKEFIAVDSEAKSRLFGEALPSGLHLG